ncbi:hypothetical protein GOODEAATRI_015895 [Goodea atripinnis]|uniref:Uncharacterized protein n=1 Tax=Goodea atripinnis TaxID=208336 RepID=A0ABV0MI60_9TELE
MLFNACMRSHIFNLCKHKYEYEVPFMIIFKNNDSHSNLTYFSSLLLVLLFSALRGRRVCFCLECLVYQISRLAEKSFQTGLATTYYRTYSSRRATETAALHLYCCLE